MAKLRLKGANGKGFLHGDLDLHAERWTEVEVTEKQRVAVRDFHGRYITVHPHDVERLKEFGLELVEPDKPLVDLKKSNSSKPATTTAATKEK